MDGAGESGASEQTPPRIKAEDNPWYLLATLYGVPEAGDDKLKERNRITWNRYFAANLDEETRTKLTEEKRHPPEELTPFSREELPEIEEAFHERCKASAKKPALPGSGAGIDFSNVEFEQKAFFEGYLFSKASFFQDATFSGEASFRDATFTMADFKCAAFFGFADFGRAAFSSLANFEVAAFYGVATFAGATFSGTADFAGATFSGTAYFNGATFSTEASFAGATFSTEAYFGGAIFFRWAFFDGATFSGSKVAFDGAAFSGKAVFDGATFSGQADFEGAIFSDHTDFGKATFGGISRFVNAEMKGETSFEGAVFKTEPPRFFGAKLHQGTVWRRIKWPFPKNKDEGGTFIDAYACLKLEMDRLKKHEDEMNFFALELQSRRVYLGRWRGFPIAIYGALSDYGRSYLRPLIALLVVASIGMGAFSYFDARTSWEALGLSAANTLNVFGFRRDLNLALDTPFAWLKVFAAVQTILGAILLFLLGLGIRNKFRMK